jgi:hypothetical protein
MFNFFVRRPVPWDPITCLGLQSYCAYAPLNNLNSGILLCSLLLCTAVINYWQYDFCVLFFLIIKPRVHSCTLVMKSADTKRKIVRILFGGADQFESIPSSEPIQFNSNQLYPSLIESKAHIQTISTICQTHYASNRHSFAEKYIGLFTVTSEVHMHESF